MLNGFTVPALDTRKVQTEIELDNGQSFAIAGLLNNTFNETIDKIPALGDIPLLGKLFQSRTRTKSNEELLIMVTPETGAAHSGRTTAAGRAHDQAVHEGHAEGSAAQSRCRGHRPGAGETAARDAAARGVAANAEEGARPGARQRTADSAAAA